VTPSEGKFVYSVGEHAVREHHSREHAFERERR
jgi:hypothetical protein